MDLRSRRAVSEGGKNKKAIIRVDFNVPLDENFNVTDATRIEAAKPTIEAFRFCMMWTS